MIIAVDTETTGLNPYLGDRPFAITYYDDIVDPRYIAIGEDDLVAIDAALMSSSVAKVFHNAKFDIQMLMVQGMRTCGEIHDTMLMAHVFNPDEPYKALKKLAIKYLGADANEEKELQAYMRKNKIKDYSKVPREIMEPYAKQDVVYTMGLYKFYKEKGVLDNPTYKAEIALLRTLIDMQVRGALIDVPYCREKSAWCKERIAQIEAEVEERFGAIKLNSNKQLSNFLFNDEGLTCSMYSSAGNPVLDAYNLRQYDHPIIPLVEEYRALVKVDKTYLTGIADKCDEEGVIHCDFYQVGAKTGRFSCREPNLQNIPRGGVVDIRRAFVCRPDYVNYYFDYSQIELRILAHYAQEEKMIDELTNPDGDLHGLTAKAIFGEDYTKEQRNIAKRLNFGIVYGIGAKHFAEVLNQTEEANYKYSDAKRFIDRYYFNYQSVRTFTWRLQRAILNRNAEDVGIQLNANALPTGYVKDVYGRIYTCEKKFSYKAVNYLIQGCAAGVLKDAMVRVHELLAGTKSSILLCIHDELVIEIHKDELDLVPDIVATMEEKEKFRVPITVNTERTLSSWDAKSSVEDETAPTQLFPEV